MIGRKMCRFEFCKIMAVIYCCSSVLVNQAAPGADDEALKVLVREEYPRALDALEAIYANVEAQALHQSQKFANGLVQAQTASTMDFACSGESLLIVDDFESRANDSFVANHDEPDSPTDAVKKSQRRQDTVMCTTATRGFRLLRADRNSPYTIAYVGEDYKPIKGNLTSQIRKTLNCAFNAHAIRLSSFVRLKGFELNHVSEEFTNSGHRVLKIQFAFKSQQVNNPNSPPIATVKEGTLIVAPDEKWALQGYELKYAQPYGFYNYTGQIEYDSSQPSVPIPKKVINQTIREVIPGAIHDPKSKPPGIISREIYEFSHVKLGPVSPDRFGLAAFGLPDITQPGVHAASRTSMSTLLIGLAIAGFIGVVGIRWYLKGSTGR